MTIASDPPNIESAEPRSDREGGGFLQPLGLTDGGTPMEQSHVSALQFKHAGIERQLREEMNRPLPDLAMIQALKKRKLRIKEELSHS
jgi:hypothetical protein